MNTETVEFIKAGAFGEIAAFLRVVEPIAVRAEPLEDGSVWSCPGVECAVIARLRDGASDIVVAHLPHACLPALTDDGYFDPTPAAVLLEALDRVSLEHVAAAKADLVQLDPARAVEPLKAVLGEIETGWTAIMRVCGNELAVEGDGDFERLRPLALATEILFGAPSEVSHNAQLCSLAIETGRHDSAVIARYFDGGEALFAMVTLPVGIGPDSQEADDAECLRNAFGKPDETITPQEREIEVRFVLLDHGVARRELQRLVTLWHGRGEPYAYMTGLQGLRRRAPWPTFRTSCAASRAARQRSRSRATSEWRPGESPINLLSQKPHALLI